jgi:hypothetical protein
LHLLLLLQLAPWVLMLPLAVALQQAARSSGCWKTRQVAATGTQDL